MGMMPSWRLAGSDLPGETGMRRSAGFAFVLFVLGTATTQSALPPRDRVSVVGSSTLFPFASLVAETFGRRGPWKTPVVQSIGTGGYYGAYFRDLDGNKLCAFHVG